MLITIDINKIDINKIKILDKQKNNIITNGNFYKILYHEKEFSLNGIYINFTLNDVKIDNYFNKLKCSFNIIENKEIVDKIVNLEQELLNKNNFDSKLITSIKDILDQGNIKIFSNGFNNINNVKNIDLILKISGIWSDKNNKGVTFKFMLP